MEIFQSLSDIFNNRELPVTKQIFNEKDRPYFETKEFHVKKKEKEVKQLILWDLENVNFEYAYKQIDKLSENGSCLKIVSLNKRMKHILKPEFIAKLRKRKWLIHYEKHDADKGLIFYFEKYKQVISSLILISADRDFEPIMKSAKELNIDAIIMNSEKKKHWADNYEYRNMQY